MQGSSVQMVQEKILRQHGIKWHQLKITMVRSCGSPRPLADLHVPTPQIDPAACCPTLHPDIPFNGQAQ